MSKKVLINLLIGIAALITIYGLITGKYIFLLILLPLGFLRTKKEN